MFTICCKGQISSACCPALRNPQHVQCCLHCKHQIVFAGMEKRIDSIGFNIWTLCFISFRSCTIATKHVNVSLRNGESALIASSENDFSLHNYWLKKILKEQ